MVVLEKFRAKLSVVFSRIFSDSAFGTQKRRRSWAAAVWFQDQRSVVERLEPRKLSETWCLVLLRRPNRCRADLLSAFHQNDLPLFVSG